ncbi:MAG: hypothetical protein WDA12_04900 [Bacilli bacterium]
MRESDFWVKLRSKIAHAGHIERIENGVAGVGTPDVNGCIGGREFWIELKCLPSWPKSGGPVSIRHFRKEQILWMRRRSMAGGRVFVFLRVDAPEPEHLLFPYGEVLLDLQGGRLTREEIREGAVAKFGKLIHIPTLITKLTGEEYAEKRDFLMWP